MKKNIFITLLLALLLMVAGCVPSQYTKGVDADEYPDKDLPVYEDAIIYEYEGDEEEVTIMYGTEDDVDDVAEFYQDYFDDEGIMLDDEDEDDDEYSAEGFYEDFEFEIKVGKAKGKNEEKEFASTAEVTIKFLSDEEIEERQGGNLSKDMVGFWKMTSLEYEGLEQSLEDVGMAMEFFSNGKLDLYVFYTNEGMTGADWTVTEDGGLTYTDPTLGTETEGTVSIEKQGKDTYMYITEVEGSYTLVKTEKDVFLENAFDLDMDDWLDENDDDAEISVPTVQERELYNQDGITVDMKGFSEGYYYLDLDLLLENTTDKEVDVDVESLVINGFSMQDAYMLGTVEANVKLNTTLSIDVEELNRCGIEEIVTMEIVFSLTDTETWDTIATSDVITVNTGSTFVQTYDNAGITLVDDQGVKIIYQDFIEDDDSYGPYVVLYIENNGDKAIDTDCDNVQVNGFMISGWLYGTIQPGTASVMILDFYTSELDENGIEEIEEIKLTFQASYADEWTDFMESELITLPLN